MAGAKGSPSTGGGGGGGGGTPAAWTTLREVDFRVDTTASSGAVTSVGPHTIYAADGVTAKATVQAHTSGSFSLSWSTSTGIEVVTTSTRWVGVPIDLTGINVENDLWLVDVVFEVSSMNTSTVCICALGTALNGNATENCGVRVDRPGASSYVLKTRYWDGSATNGSSEAAASSLYGAISLQIVPRGNWAWTSVFAENSGAYLTAQQGRDGSTYYGGQPGFKSMSASTTVTGQYSAGSTYIIWGGTGGGTTRLLAYRVRRFQ